MQVYSCVFAIEPHLHIVIKYVQEAVILLVI